ncbi:MAG TPA: SidA/IucD/PvdA family monooxygenase, partial [Propionibacteriaceae bacterium]|nr:SidA/IucD/PvdA family monooxygenase [Propionibacteriaceae bacterium]
MTVDEIDVVAVGAGRAGLATSHELTALGVAHEVFERADVVARHVVVASGGLRTAYRPSWAAEPRVTVVDASQYRNPESLPAGAVLVVGSGQTGCQLAEELLTSGRRVVQACGRAPWMPRRIGGRDTFDCLTDTGFMDQALADIPAGPAARFMANPQATGRDGGHDLTTRTLQALGVELAGHVAGIDGNSVVFADDLADSVAFSDARWG